MPPAGGDRGLVPSGGFVWRTPLLPVDELTAWGERLRAPAAVEAGEDPGAAVAADRAALRQRLAVAVVATLLAASGALPRQRAGAGRL